MSLGDDRAVVARIVAARWPGARPGIGVVLKDWNRNRVARWVLEDVPMASVISKAILGSPANGYNDWAALAFLADGPTAGLAPALLGGDDQAGVFVMED